MAITKKQRHDVEMLIYKVMDTLDPTEQNSAWYKEKFRNMNDDQFYKFFQQEFPIKFQMKVFEIEPNLEQMYAVMDNILHVPVMENVNLPFLYRNKDGKPVGTNYKATVVYVPMKKMKQFLAKKNSMSINIDERNMKTGRLFGADKNGNTSDREFECMAVMGLEKTMKEFSTYRADTVNAKNEFYNTIATKGMVSLDDVDVSVDDSISRNTLNAYLIGAGINTNLINIGNYLPGTVKGKEAVKIKRQ